ncbi:MAG: HAMP domain-containing sensor histidine kinase [Planctomycetota bacterium]
MFRKLPDIVIDRRLVSLGCAESDLVELAILFGRSGIATRRNEGTGAKVEHAGALCRLFRQSPLLLIFAFSEFVSFGTAPPRSFTELANWFLRNGPGRLTTGVHDWQPAKKIELATRSEDFNQAYAGFRVARTSSRLRKSLVAMMTTLYRFRSKPLRRWIDAVCGKKLSTEDLEATINAVPANGTADLTDMKQLFELSAHAAEHQAEFDRRLLEEKLKSMKQLAYGASHEINNPLANIATRAQSLLKGENAPDKRRKLAVIYQQAMRAHEMISDMMLFAHPPAAKPANCDINQLTRDVVADMRSMLRESGVHIKVNLYPDTSQAVVDSTQFSVALAGLIKNAIEAHQSADGSAGRKKSAPLRIGPLNDGDDKISPSIDVSIWNRDQATVAVSVTDNGPGPSADALRHMFDPYFSGREAGRGLGFGLSKAWRICEINGGMLEFDGSRESGARFVMTFPASHRSIERIDNSAAA